MIITQTRRKSIYIYSISVDYSFDKITWATATPYSSSASSSAVITTTSDKVYFRRVGNTFTNIGDSSGKTKVFNVDTMYDVSGNIMSLLYGDDFRGKIKFPTTDEKTLASLFYSQKKIRYAHNLRLPATTLSFRCYYSMFRYSTLQTPPQLPATTLAPYCYQAFVASCYYLKEAPKLPATTLAEGCYWGVFYDSPNITPPKLPATILVNGCYSEMFWNSSITNPPKLPAKTLAERCYMSMFKGCASITTGPYLPATKLVTNCYNQMFSGAYRLNSLKVAFTEIPAESNALYDWMNTSYAYSPKFYKPEAATYVDSDLGLPSGWTVVTY